MELRHLRYFTAVARELNFRRAAEVLHIAQPPLSMQIKDLEHELGVRLFDRSSRSVTLTAAGSRFLVDAQRILSEAQQAQIDVKKAARGIIGRLNIGFMLSTAHNLLGSAVKKFKHDFPEVELNLLDLTNSAQIKALEEGRLDIAFTRTKISKPDLQTEILTEEPMMLMVPSTDSLAKKKRLAWRDLEGKAIITLHPDQALGFYDHFFARCQLAKVSVTTGQYANDLHTEMWLVSIGMGVAPTSLTTSYVRRPNISFCQLPADLPQVQTAMSWRKLKHSPATVNFIEIIRQIATK
jgi:DNA-binding transcriptional LysR family regulator